MFGWVGVLQNYYLPASGNCIYIHTAWGFISFFSHHVTLLDSAKPVANPKLWVFFTHVAVKLCLPSLYLCTSALSLKVRLYIRSYLIWSGWFQPGCFFFLFIFWFNQIVVPCSFGSLVIRSSESSCRSLLTSVWRMGWRPRAQWQLLNNFFLVDINQSFLSSIIQWLTHLIWPSPAHSSPFYSQGQSKGPSQKLCWTPQTNIVTK